ncbi:hypothetical protein, partial [Citrobacter freundii]
ENSSSYSLNAGVNSEGSGNTQGTFSAYYSRPLKWSNISANVYSSEGNYTSFGASATGGITLTTKGGGSTLEDSMVLPVCWWIPTVLKILQLITEK